LSAILQIVPRVPGGIDGVGDYALTLAANLRDKFGCATVFATSDVSSSTIVRNFEVRPLYRVQDQVGEFDHILLHYVNYGYQKRGVPFGLLSILRRIRRHHRGKLLTVFHELYASGPPSSSAFWLQPLQIHLTKSVARLSDECIVSSENFSRELQRLAPRARIHLHPTPSGLEEPSLSPTQIGSRGPHRWVIVGGTVLAERSLRSFVRVIQWIPEPIAPRTLFVLGGNENPASRSLLAELAIESDYRPRIASTDASEILRTCSFTWFNYFHRPDIETSVVLKSSAFAAACAHAVIPIFPHRAAPISIDGDHLPGPFFIETEDRKVPELEELPRIAADVYNWYQRHASSERLAQGIAHALDWSSRP
jgi:hypothetical protein